MIYVLKCIELAKEFQLEVYSFKAEIKRAEIMALFDMPSESLKVLEGVAEKIELLSNSSTKIDYELVKAKVLTRLQRILAGDSINTSTPLFYEAAIHSLQKALKLSVSQCNLITMREVFYLLSRLYQKLGKISERDQAALKFLEADEELRINSKNTLGYICHFNLLELIDATTKQIDEFTQKYN